jgi:L-lactate dehydrogenase complex protein LldG
MTNIRDSILQHIRRAVAEGNRLGPVPELENRGSIGYQGAGADPVARFRETFTNAGGQFHLVLERDAVIAKVRDLIQVHSARKVLLGAGPVLQSLNLRQALQASGLEVTDVELLDATNCQAPFFAADIGISGVQYLIAETGTAVMASNPSDPRSVSLLPPVHIAIAERRQLMPDLFDLFAKYRAGDALPSCLTLITGPSKTGDIELRLVTGVHGPGGIHVILQNG